MPRFPNVAGRPGNPAARSIPVGRIADMLLRSSGAAYRFNGMEHRYLGSSKRLVYWAGGILSTTTRTWNRLQAAWRRPELPSSVHGKTWWTPTARRADIVLPTTTIAWNATTSAFTVARDGYVFTMHRALPPQGYSRVDFDIYRELAAKSGYRGLYTEGHDAWRNGWRTWTRARQAGAAARADDLPRRAAVRGFLGTGILWRCRPRAGTSCCSEEFRRMRWRIGCKRRSGTHRAGIPNALPVATATTIAPWPSGLGWLPAEWLGADAARHSPLHLVSSQPAHRLCIARRCWISAPLSRASKIQGREPVQHPSCADATVRGIRDGALVRIHNDRGVMRVAGRDCG